MILNTQPKLIFVEEYDFFHLNLRKTIFFWDNAQNSSYLSITFLTIFLSIISRNAITNYDINKYIYLTGDMLLNLVFFPI
jgi:hypothetical protein